MMMEDPWWFPLLVLPVAIAINVMVNILQHIETRDRLKSLSDNICKLEKQFREHTEGDGK